MAIEYSEAQDPNLEPVEIDLPEVATDDPIAQEEPVVDEGVEVAGLRRKISDVAGKISDNIANVVQKPVRKEGEDLTKPAKEFGTADQEPIVQVTEGGFNVRRATAEEMAGVSSWGVNPDADNIDIIMPNLQAVGLVRRGDTIETNDEALAGLYTQMAEIFELYKSSVDAKGKSILRKGDRGYDDILKDADRIGSVRIIKELLTRKTGDRPFTDAELAAARKMSIAMAINTNNLINNYKRTNSPMDLTKAAQAISLQGYVDIMIHGVQEDIGRTLVSMKIVAAPSKARIEALRTMMSNTEALNLGPTAVIGKDNVGDFMEAYGGEEGMKQLINFYERLPSDQKQKFAQRSLFRKGADMLVELYQSALLTNPLTHSFNMAGNIIMMETQMIERMLQGKPRESFAMLTAQAKYMPQAFRAMWYALKNEASLTDATSKLDIDMKAISRSGVGLRNKKEGGGTIESTAGMAFDAFGVMMRLGGYRPMIAMDEFSKSLARGMQIEALAVRAKSDAYRATIDAGKSKEDAKQAGIDTYMKMLHSESAFDEASEFARMVTFQDDLPGVLGDAMPLLSHPIMKIWLPFYKTPTQIVRRLGERSPFALAMPSVMRDKLIRGSAEERKEAMAKIAFGSSIAATTMYLGKGGVSDDFVMTGYGPTDKSRSRWLENHRPYSIGIRKENGSFDWVSYERYDPISGIIGMAMDGADVVEKAWDGGWDSFSVDTGLNLAFVIGKYPSQALPMIQFLGELTDMAGSPYMSAEDKLARVEGMFAKQVIKAGLIVKEQVQSGGVFGDSLQATFERFQDPVARSTIPEDQYGGNIVDAYYQALHEMRARTPGLSTTLPTRKNRWYEEVYQTGHTMDDGRARGNIWQTFLPYKVMNKPEKSLINQELEILNNGLSPLRRNMNEPKIKLTGTQYDRYIELYNYPWRVNDPDNELNIEEGLTAREAIEELLKYPEYYDLSYGQRLNEIRKIDTVYKQNAKKLMLFEFPELGALIAQRDAFEDATGRLPKKLNNVTENELLNFLDSRE